MSGARVYFIGGGPGAADLLTLRGARAIAAADVVVWGRSLVSEEVVTEHARPTAELAPWPPLSADGLLDVYDRARRDGLTVARVYGGDPTIYGWVHEEIASVTERGLPYEVIPGVTSMAAAAAAAGCTLSGGMLIVARREGWRPLPPGERIRDYARHGTTMALYMASREPHELQRELTEGGYDPATPCVIVHRTSWPDERILRCPLDELGDRIEAGRLDHQTLVFVGPGTEGVAD
ncbi:MAG: cobalt-precorrin-4/precorrin-4 C(11)-methyltransferase [Thermoleophilaceae bacterium]|nr:cobalt-precorrin-4/precorrin-4 C(11)-methyltransferase [Thermoleophilaceae bacterium]